MIVQVKEINVGERLRENFGDIEGLAESIKINGLLHPIIVDENLNLIAGHRRLTAIKTLAGKK